MELAAQRQRSSSSSSSPEFEFWKVRDPSLPAAAGLLAADELIVDGVLLPLDLLSLHRPSQLVPPPSSPPALSSSPATSSKRWKDYFKTEKKADEKERRKDQRGTGIWPFSRSRSAGYTATAAPRPRSESSRKVCSAPCSRSNSRGESSARTGFHLARSSPVWQFRRNGVGSKEKAKKPAPTASTSAGNGVRVLNLNVNSCIGGYRNQVSCRGEGTSGARTVEANGSDGAAVFSFKTLFSKKVY